MTQVHDYETDLDSRSYSRLYHEESAIAFSAMDCVLNGGKAIYASSELTTGKRTYARLQEHGLRSLRELDESHRRALLATNIEEATTFARQIREHFRGRELVITPAPYLAPGWTQAEYLTFWEALIRTRIKAVYFNSRWEYSNGCAFEFAIASENAIPTLDAELRALSLNNGIMQVTQAIADLKSRGFDAHRLRISLDRLRRIA